MALAMAGVCTACAGSVDGATNLPAMCIEQQDVTLDYDFEGFHQGHLSFFQTATPDCANNPGDYCKGGIEADLGRLVISTPEGEP